MDNRLDTALKLSNYNLSLQAQRENLKLRLTRLLFYSTGGGTFKISPELIGFIHSCVERGDENVILLDQNSIPILITDLKEFERNITERYHEASLEYYQEYSKSKRARNVQDLTGFKNE
jgi:hypothetical protein